MKPKNNKLYVIASINIFFYLYLIILILIINLISFVEILNIYFIKIYTE